MIEFESNDAESYLKFFPFPSLSLPKEKNLDAFNQCCGIVLVSAAYIDAATFLRRRLKYRAPKYA